MKRTSISAIGYIYTCHHIHESYWIITCTYYRHTHMHIWPENRPLLINFFWVRKPHFPPLKLLPAGAEVAVCCPWRWRPFWTAVATSARAIWWRAPRCRRQTNRAQRCDIRGGIRRRSHRNAAFKAFGKSSIEVSGGVSGKLCLNPKMSDDYCAPRESHSDEGKLWMIAILWLVKVSHLTFKAMSIATLKLYDILKYFPRGKTSSIFGSLSISP